MVVNCESLLRPGLTWAQNVPPPLRPVGGGP